MRVAFPLVFVALATTASADVWTVDDNGPANFTSIQLAIDAAADGDVILVQDGNYPGFTIDNKDVSVIGVGAVAGTVASGGSLIVNLSATRSAVVSRLTLRGADGIQALNVEPCVGAIRLHDCVITGFSPTTMCHSGTDALTITGANNVVLNNCTMQGGTGDGGGGYHPTYGLYGCAGGGGRAISILGTSMALFNTHCTGGNAGIATTGFSGAEARGGDGFGGGGSFLFACESPMSGGVGAGLYISATVCNQSSGIITRGRGGHGCSFESANASTAWFTVPSLTAGSYGPSNCFFAIPESPFATMAFKRGPAGSMAARIGGVAHRTTMPAHLAGATTASCTFTGAPGELVDVLISPLPDFVWSQAMKGVWGINQAAALTPIPAGVIGATNQLVTTIAFPALAPGEPNHQWFVQAVFTGTASVLGAPTTVTLVP